MRTVERQMIKELLKRGPVMAMEVWKRAEELGLSRRTVERAKKELGVRSKKLVGTQWIWYYGSGPRWFEEHRMV